MSWTRVSPSNSCTLCSFSFLLTLNSQFAPVLFSVIYLPLLIQSVAGKNSWELASLDTLVSSPRFLALDLVKGRQYCFRVRSINKYGVSDPSEPSRPIWLAEPRGESAHSSSYISESSEPVAPDLFISCWFTCSLLLQQRKPTDSQMWEGNNYLFTESKGEYVLVILEARVNIRVMFIAEL